MELLIASICKTKDSHLQAAEKEYIKRFPRHLPLRVIELGGEKYLKSSPDEQEKKFDELLTSKVPVQKKTIILLDERGKEKSTEELSNYILGKIESGLDRLAFAIGGPTGWSEKTKQEADITLSLSKMTMPYQLARLILIEQLYRCFTIQANMPYHRD